MNQEIDNTYKSKTHLGTKRYRMMTLNSDIVVTHEALFEKFGYHSDYVKLDEPLEIWYNKDKIEKLIEDIINNSEFELLSVSEDNTSFRYHFISK